MTIDHIYLKERHKGKDIYILGSGGSLDFINSSFFENKITIGINRVYKNINVDYVVVKHHSFIQDAIDAKKVVIMSQHNSGNNTEKVNDFNADYFFTHKLSRAENEDENFNHNLSCIKKDEDIFVGFSTIVSGIHLAAYMGAKNIILCGHDCGYIDGKAYLNCKDGFPEDLIRWHNNKEKCIAYYNEWFREVESQSIRLKKKIEEVYGCNICSLNPFINFNLEGHKYDTAK